jgi:serpin B
MPRRFVVRSVLISLVAVAALGCTDESNTPLVPVVSDTFSTPEARNQFTEGSNKFAFDLYSRLREREGNIVVSPVSVATALGMVLAGARGQTEQEIATVLHVAGLSRDEAHRAAADLQNDLNGRGEERDFTLSIANRLWAQEDQSILDDFSALIKEHYGADIGRVDFINKPDAAVKQVNAWAARATRNKIDAALDRNHVDELTRLILVNAVYFKAKWASPFKEVYTDTRDFFRSKNDVIQVSTMFEQSYFHFRHIDGIKVLRKPYAGLKVSMLLLLPDQIDGLTELESHLTIDNVTRWSRFENQGSQEVNFVLPKFKFNADLRLNGVLELLGMPSAFDQVVADFSGVNGVKASDKTREGLFIQHAIQRAFIDVDEEGTEAAATTAIAKKTTSTAMRPLEFTADHPFLFFIQDQETEAILFMGRVADPSQE